MRSKLKAWVPFVPCRLVATADSGAPELEIQPAMRGSRTTLPKLPPLSQAVRMRFCLRVMPVCTVPSLTTTPCASLSDDPFSNWLGALNRLAAQLWPEAAVRTSLMPRRSACSRASPAVCSSAPLPTVMVLFWTTKPLALMSSTGITADE